MSSPHDGRNADNTGVSHRLGHHDRPERDTGEAILGTRYGAGVFSGVASRMGMRSLSGALANSPELRRNGQSNWPSAYEETKRAMARHAGDGRCRFYIGAHSPYSCTPELLREVRARADELGVPFVIHLAENKKENDDIRAQYGKSPVAWLESLGVLDGPSILAHCVWVDQQDIDILASKNAGVAHNPVSNAKLASGVAPVPAMRAKRIAVGLGTDSTLSNNSLDLFQEMKFSVLLQRAMTLNGFIARAGDAFSMATIEGAKVLGWADEIGSIEAGKQADFIILDIAHPLGLTADRVLSDLVYRTGPRDVQTVVVAGEIIYADGQFTRFDAQVVEDEIYAHYQNSK